MLIAAIVGGYLLYKKATCPPFVFDLLNNKNEFIAYSTSSNAKTSFDAIKSVGCWVKLNPNTTDTERQGIIMGNYPTGPQVLNVEVVSRRTRIYMNGGVLDWFPTDILPIDTWAHILFVIKASTIEYYRDGVLKETFTAPSAAPLNGLVPVQGTISNIKYGYDNRGNDVSVNAPNFKVANMFVSDEALTQDKINNLLNCKPA